MRVVHGALFRLGDADFAQQGDGLVPGLFFGAARVEEEDLAELAADAVHRVQCGHGLLENHADIAAPDGAEFVVRDLGEILAVEADGA